MLQIRLEKSWAKKTLTKCARPKATAFSNQSMLLRRTTTYIHSTGRLGHSNSMSAHTTALPGGIPDLVSLATVPTRLKHLRSGHEHWARRNYMAQSDASCSDRLVALFFEKRFGQGRVEALFSAFGVDAMMRLHRSLRQRCLFPV